MKKISVFVCVRLWTIPLFVSVSAQEELAANRHEKDTKVRNKTIDKHGFMKD